MTESAPSPAAATRSVNGRPVPAVGTWTFEAGNSSIGFVARHLVVSKVRGSFREFTGQIEVAEDPLASRVAVQIAAASIDTGMPFRDRDLRGTDFLDVERYPTMEFVSSAVRAAANDWVVAGELTIAGHQREVELVMQFGGVAVDPWGHTKAVFAAETQIVREDWGLTYNKAIEGGGVLIGSELKIEIEIQARPASAA